MIGEDRAIFGILVNLHACLRLPAADRYQGRGREVGRFQETDEGNLSLAGRHFGFLPWSQVERFGLCLK